MPFATECKGFSPQKVGISKDVRCQFKVEVAACAEVENIELKTHTETRRTEQKKTRIHTLLLHQSVVLRGSGLNLALSVLCWLLRRVLMEFAYFRGKKALKRGDSEDAGEAGIEEGEQSEEEGAAAAAAAAEVAGDNEEEEGGEGLGEDIADLVRPEDRERLLEERAGAGGGSKARKLSHKSAEAESIRGHCRTLVRSTVFA